MVKEGAAVIDVGINRIKDPKTGKLRLIGDVDFAGKYAKFFFVFKFLQKGICVNKTHSKTGLSVKLPLFRQYR